MKKFFPLSISTAAALCAALLFSCASDIDMPKPPGEFTEPQSYCVYQETQQCFPGGSHCPGGGTLSGVCPYSSSSSSIEGTTPGGNSSSSSALEYNYCVFASEKECLPGPVSICPGGGTLSDVCPYSSSSSQSGNGTSSSSGGRSNSSQCPAQTKPNYFTDQRDCKEYEYKRVPNGQFLMSENLNYSKNNTLGWCYKTGESRQVLGDAGEDLPGCDSPYGRIYTWEIAMDGNNFRGLCPSGWHIPTVDEWRVMINPSNVSGFISVFAGNYNQNSKYPPLGWKNKGNEGYWWTSDGNNFFLFVGSSTSPVVNSTATDGDYFSVRCVADDGFEPICGTGGTYNPSTQFCSSTGVLSLCGGKTYNPSTQFCSGTVVYSLCGGETYDPAGEFCSSGEIYTKCGGNTYNPSTQFCSGEVVYSRCNGETYDPELKVCTSIGLVAAFKDARDGNVYGEVTIGTQVWMSKNLCYDNINSGSSCSNEILYDWTTASSICPSGWKLPSIQNWNTLTSFVGVSVAATKLKAKSGWSSIGTDDYGFTALPNNGNNEGKFWSSNQQDSNNGAYLQIGYNSETYINNDLKTKLYGVRCLKN